jgi:hypothetical protein
VHCGDFLRLVFENVRGPERTVDPGAEILELRGQTAIDYVYAAQEGISIAGFFCHEQMLPPKLKNLNLQCNYLAESLERVAFTPDRIPMPIITTAPTTIQCSGIRTRCAAYASPMITIANPAE